MLTKRRRATALGYALLAPSLFGVFTFLLLPLLVVIWLSLYRWDLLGPLRYVGMYNWRSVLTDSGFLNSLIVTAIFVAIVVPAQTVLGLLCATMLAPAASRHRPVPHAVRAAVDLRAGRDRGAVALDPGPYRRGRRHRAGAPHRVAVRSQPGAAGRRRRW